MSAVTACAVAQPSAPTDPAVDVPPTVSDAEALAAAAPVFAAAGLSGTSPTLADGGPAPMRYVTVDGQVDGLPTLGLTTSVTVAFVR